MVPLMLNSSPNMKCKNCNKELDTAKRIGRFCSTHCYEEWAKQNNAPNCKCVICGREFYMKPSRIKRNTNGVVCSKECSIILRSQYMSGTGNHQYGLIGKLNSSYKGETTISNYGYVLVYCPDHPFARKGNNRRILQHRLVIEANADKFDDKYFTTISGKKYLLPKYDVHHINENKQDNRIENLMIVTRSEHTTYHNSQNTILRNELGQIIGITKSGKNGEPCDGNTVLNEQITKGCSSV